MGYILIRRNNQHEKPQTGLLHCIITKSRRLSEPRRRDPPTISSKPCEL